MNLVVELNQSDIIVQWLKLVPFSSPITQFVLIISCHLSVMDKYKQEIGKMPPPPKKIKSLFFYLKYTNIYLFKLLTIFY